MVLETVLLIPTSTMSGKVVSTALNGTFTVNSNNTCTKNINNDNVYTLTIAESGNFKKITFSNGSNAVDAPMHNGINAEINGLAELLINQHDQSRLLKIYYKKYYNIF